MESARGKEGGRQLLFRPSKIFYMEVLRMNLSEYFDKTKGFGVLATADSDGKVNVAVFSKPTFIDDETIVFVMADHLNHHNLQSNASAAYIFKEEERYDGRKLYLTKIKEEEGTELIEAVRKKRYPIFSAKYDNESKYLVYFHIDKVLRLVADGVLRPDIT